MSTDAASATRNWNSGQSAAGWGARPLVPASRGSRPGGHRTAEEMQLSEARSRAAEINKTGRAQAISLAVSLRAVRDTRQRLERDEPAPSGVSTEQVRQKVFMAHKKVVANAFKAPTVIVDSNGLRTHRDPKTLETPEPPAVKVPSPALVAVLNAEHQDPMKQTQGQAPVGSARRLVTGVPLKTIAEEQEASSMRQA